MYSNCKDSQKKGGEVLLGNVVVKNIVIMIWMELEINRQVGGRGVFYCSGQLDLSRVMDNRPTL